MPAYRIRSADEWASLAQQKVGNALLAGDVVTLHANITLTSITHVLELGGATFNGRGFTISINIPGESLSGFINMTSAGMVQNLKVVVVASGTCTSVLLSSGSAGTVQNCEISGATIAANGGVVIGTANGPLTCRRLRISTTTLAASSSGGILSASSNTGPTITVEKCALAFTNTSTGSAVCTAMSSGTLSINQTYAVFSPNAVNENSAACFVGTTTVSCAFTDCTSVGGRFFVNSCTGSGTLAPTRCTFFSARNDAAFINLNQSTVNYTVTECFLLAGTGNYFIGNSANGNTITLTRCGSNQPTQIKNTGTGTVSGTLSDVSASNLTVNGLGLSGANYENDPNGLMPMLKVFMPAQAEFINYTSADSNTVTRVLLVYAADGADTLVVAEIGKFVLHKVKRVVLPHMIVGYAGATMPTNIIATVTLALSDASAGVLAIPGPHVSPSATLTRQVQMSILNAFLSNVYFVPVSTTIVHPGALSLLVTVSDGVNSAQSTIPLYISQANNMIVVVNKQDPPALSTVTISIPDEDMGLLTVQTLAGVQQSVRRESLLNEYTLTGLFPLLQRTTIELQANDNYTWLKSHSTGKVIRDFVGDASGTRSVVL